MKAPKRVPPAPHPAELRVEAALALFERALRQHATGLLPDEQWKFVCCDMAMALVEREDWAGEAVVELGPATRIVLRGGE